MSYKPREPHLTQAEAFRQAEDKALRLTCALLGLEGASSHSPKLDLAAAQPAF